MVPDALRAISTRWRALQRWFRSHTPQMGAVGGALWLALLASTSSITSLDFALGPTEVILASVATALVAVGSWSFVHRLRVDGASTYASLASELAAYCLCAVAAYLAALAVPDLTWVIWFWGFLIYIVPAFTVATLFAGVALVYRGRLPARLALLHPTVTLLGAAFVFRGGRLGSAFLGFGELPLVSTMLPMILYGAAWFPYIAFASRSAGIERI